ncbi:hypothetical protein R3W88_017639 [Solanum pinnatisectum]|uniref:Protein kinase domain-containing protein n=1 Tax=Solanum pinnatisectum TaxID=50273 RepID=A0AAV9L142_9SOLN|nr:hypothetical protein R3W88_017639 [Solanum pinnatisectum]
MLRGLNHIHAIGYVHCDMKPENVLLVLSSSKGSVEFRAKIGDLGLAKREGTPMYLSPEAVADNVPESAADIWALVFEMLPGKPPWNQKDVLRKIGEGHELPMIRGDFLHYRWTAEMLLIHPFVEGLSDDDDGVEERQEVEDINEVDSMQLVTETDDEVSYSQEDWSCISEEESVGYWSEDDTEITEDEVASCFAEERMSIRSSSIDSGFNSMIDTSSQVASQNPSNNSSICPLKFTIPSGVLALGGRREI